MVAVPYIWLSPPAEFTTNPLHLPDGLFGELILKIVKVTGTAYRNGAAARALARIGTLGQ